MLGHPSIDPATHRIMLMTVRFLITQPFYPLKSITASYVELCKLQKAQIISFSCSKHVSQHFQVSSNIMEEQSLVAATT